MTAANPAQRMPTSLAPYYRRYDLPWSPSEEMERRFRTILRNIAILAAIIALIMPFLPRHQILVNTDSLPEMGYVTARGYLPEIRRVTARAFLSVNQEAKAVVPGVGPQQCVSELMDEEGGFEVLSRQRYWMRQGYVEEVFEPSERVHA